MSYDNYLQPPDPCPGCGGVVGIDCFNEQECIQIAQSYYHDPHNYDQGEFLNSELIRLEHEVKVLKATLINYNIEIPDLTLPVFSSSTDDDLDELPF